MAQKCWILSILRDQIVQLELHLHKEQLRDGLADSRKVRVIIL